MSAWPSLDRSDDLRLAQALAAGELDALAQLVDLYAARLFDYCHALLRDQKAASSALHDAFIAAYVHVGRLGEQDRFRSWLYALARNECLRRLQDHQRPTERHEAPEVDDVFMDAEDRAQRQETRQLVHSALSGLRGREREALDLVLRHGLVAPEIGGALCVGDQEASDLIAEARRRLDDGLAAAMIARDGRDECPSVAALVDDGQWPLTPPVARKLIRHIETCPTCMNRRDRRVATGRLLQVLPVALMPADVRPAILTTAGAPAPSDKKERIALAAEPFDEWGWPVSKEQQPQGEGRRAAGPPRLLPAVVAAAVVILIVAGAFMWMPGDGSSKTGAQSPRQSSAAPGDPSETPTDTSTSPSDSPTPSDTPTTETPTPTPTPTPSTSSPTPTPSRSTRPPKKSPPPSSRPSPPGTLSVTGCRMTTAEQSSCVISVRAVGGPVNWAVVGTSGGVRAGGGGHLGTGGSTTVRAFRPSSCDGGTSGSVRFSSGASASVSWVCAETPPDDPPKP